MSLAHQPDVVVSLNLLGQIPLYWRDRVHQILKRNARMLPDEGGDFTGGLQNALERSFAELQSAHIKGLNDSGASRLIVTTDKSFCYYLPDQVDWEESSALFIDTVEEWLPNYTRSLAKSWWWSIVPPGEEGAAFGTAHRVLALAFTRR